MILTEPVYNVLNYKKNFDFIFLQMLKTNHKEDDYDAECIYSYIPPKNSKLKEYISKPDNSNLFFLFINVKDCNDAHNAIVNYTKGENGKNIELRPRSTQK